MTNATELLERLTADRAALVRRQALADRAVAASSAGHLVHELHGNGDGGAARRPWRIDPVPFLLDSATFDRLAAGVVERVTALEQILADLYGPRRLVADGVVPGEALSASTRYRVGTIGSSGPSRWLTTYAVDLVELVDGTWRVVQDYTDTPTGVGYALLDRMAMLPVIEELFDSVDGDVIASLAGVAGELRHALASTAKVASPRIVLFSGGGDSAGYVEHSQLARLLGFTLVERPDLVVRQGRLWLRTLGGLDPVDVVYRRVDDHDTDPIELSAPGGGGVPGLITAVTNGGVVLANAHGAGLVEDPLLSPFWEAAAEAMTPATLRLPRLAETARTGRFAQVPAFLAGDVGRAPVVARLHVIAGPDGVTVVPGGNGRVLAEGDDPRQPTARTVKDVWVLDQRRSLHPVVAPLPQVDLAASVPTRAADALYWAGRAAARAEAIARLIREVTARRRQDPMLATLDGGRWARRMAGLLRSVADTGDAEAGRERGSIVELNNTIAAAGAVVADRLVTFLAEAATVGEFLPASTVRIFNALAQHAEQLGATRPAAETIDDVLAALASFAGSWNESTVRGPAWRFGEIGLRIGRALVLLELVSSCVDGIGDEVQITGAVDRDTLEVLLAANECLVAYRRQYRSDVELAPTLDLLLRDRDNPRGYVSCIARLAEHVADLGWEEGAVAVRRLEQLGQQPADTIAALRAFAEQVDDTWFATPVKPMLVRGGRSGAT